MSGQKHDQAKPRFSLIPNGTLMPVVRVLEMGARKYAVDNWQHVPDARTRYFDALHRHVDAWQQGERFDSESGESHLAHAICCLMFMMWLDQNERDDLVSKNEPKNKRPDPSTCIHEPVSCWLVVECAKCGVKL